MCSSDLEDVQNYIDGKTPKSVAASRPIKLGAPTLAQPLPKTTSKETPQLKPLPAVSSITVADRKESIKGYTKTMMKTMTAANVRIILQHFA